MAVIALSIGGAIGARICGLVTHLSEAIWTVNARIAWPHAARDRLRVGIVGIARSLTLVAVAEQVVIAAHIKRFEFTVSRDLVARVRRARSVVVAIGVGAARDIRAVAGAGVANLTRWANHRRAGARTGRTDVVRRTGV